MTTAAPTLRSSTTPWAVVVVASLAMVGTLPGRSQGIGLITEPLLAELLIDRVRFAEINLWTSLSGSVFAIAFGPLFDRWESRFVALTLALLGLTVLGLSCGSGIVGLMLGLWLSRGLGQSALSAGSLSLIGKVARDRPPSVMASYSILLSVGFMIVFPLVGSVVRLAGWRMAWGAVGFVLILLALVTVLVLHRLPLASPQAATPDSGSLAQADFTLGEALATPAFWVFGLSSSLYGLVASGIGLFNESILSELGFPPELFLRSLAVSAVSGLLGNFLGGWLMNRTPSRALMVIAMSLLALGLAALPHLRSTLAVYLQASVMGVAGGLVTVLFFSYWPRTFGKSHLGSIQGVAQFLTVVASAAGPLLLAWIQQSSGSYALAFRILALVTASLGIAAWLVRTPSKQARSPESLKSGLARP